MATVVKRKRVVINVYHGDRQRQREDVEKKFRVTIGFLSAIVILLSVFYAGYAMENAKIHTVYGNEYSIPEAARELMEIHFK